ncbi:mobilization protein [Pectobacterium peruviense]|uniref:mobilization protein n=1 Tax=Pectobacterium peruviense TaxID=2066479 RepID=UPI003CC6633E
MAGKLQQFAEHVRDYLTGTEPQRQGVSALEQSGGQLARAGRELEQELQPLDALIRQHDRVRAEKLREQQPEPQKKPIRYQGPSM